MTGQSLLSDVHALIYPYQVVMTVAVPVLDLGDNSVRNVLVGQIKMERIWEIIRDVSVGAGGDTLLLDQRGLVVAHSKDPDQVLRPLDCKELIQAIRDTKQGIVQFGESQSMISAFVPVDKVEADSFQTGWHVVLTQPVRNAYASAYQLRRGLVWTGLAALAAVFVLGTLLSRQVSRRVLCLVEAARDLGRGIFKSSLKDLGADEIGELARAMEQAGRQLADSDREIKKYQENLHGLVKQQTQELLATNAKLRQEIEERKAIEKARGRLEDQLRQSQKMDALGTFAGGIAHDFNNILQVVSSHVQLLLFRCEDGSLRDALKKIEQTVARAADLVRRLLTFSRRADAKREPVDLNLEVQNVVALLQRTLPKMIRIETRLAEDLNNIVADPAQMEQILMNLAGNARDAMPKGGVLTIETKNVILDEQSRRKFLGLEPGPHVMLTLADTGCGMDLEVSQHIFEPFFTTKGVGKGTGLGLAMVYGIVKDHRGHIACDSTPGQGTAFTIHFPVFIGNAATEQLREAMRTRASLEGVETILMVDDEAMIRDVTLELLTSCGYSVLSAGSGEEALEIYSRERERIDLVITDLGMPGMGGEALLIELLRIDPQTRVIVASGYAAASDNANLQQAAAFIAKPYTYDSLLGLVRRVLDGCHMPGQF